MGTRGLPSKICAGCGRRFEWRRRWRRDWESVRYCGERCRRSKPGPTDRRLEAAILELLGRRPNGATICPSEAARVIDADGWRALMQRTRRAAGRLAFAGQIEVLRGGRVVELARARGPIRLRRRQGDSGGA